MADRAAEANIADLLRDAAARYADRPARAVQRPRIVLGAGVVQSRAGAL